MKRIFFVVFLALICCPHFIFAQKTDAQKSKTKTYQQMGYDEKLRYVAAKADQVLSLFGRTEGDEINQEGLRMIMNSLDNYVRRFSRPTLDSCDQSKWVASDLTSVLKRGSKNAAAINEEFTAQKIQPQVGLYVAMIESEFCPCIQSPIGALGMFQFTKVTGENYGLRTIENASPTNPDDRCQPKLAARASGKYMRKMIDDIFGNDSVGLPMTIAAYNSGEGMRKIHIRETVPLTKAPRISFWVLIETRDKLREKFEANTDSDGESTTPVYFKQFEEENIYYVPKFFAAAIIGENPQNFGINLMPLSSYKN
jgi:hypothetical protein